MQNHAPRLEPVTGTPFNVKCQHCGGLMGAGNGFDAVADLDGTPWSAYYHGDASHNCQEHAGEYPAGDGVGFRHQISSTRTGVADYE